MSQDAGVRVVQTVFRLLQIEDRWSVTQDCGFIWWGGPLAQRVWAEPPFRDDEFEVSRVHIRTDLLGGFRGTASQFARLGALMRHSSVSGPVRDPADPSRVQLAASLYVHGETVGWLGRVASLVAALQAAEAHIWADQLAELLEAAPATSSHPRSGPREDLDDMLDVIEAVLLPDSGEGSAYRGEEMLRLQELLDQPPCVLAGGGPDGYTAEFPFGPMTSLLRLLTGEPHPRLGNGLLMLLTMPTGGEDDPAGGGAVALALNELELQSQTRCHFLGSWAPGEAGLTFASFYPNTLAGIAPGAALAFTQAHIMRAYWVAVNVFKQAFDYEAALEAKQEQLKVMTELLTTGKPKGRKGKKRRGN